MNTKHFLRALAAILSLAVTLPASAQACRGDINADGRVDGGDLGTVLAWWGPVVLTNPVSVACDLDNSGRIDGADLGLLLSNWGVCTGTVTSITPNQGCIVGGTQITITGTYLGSTSAVTIGGAPATSFTVVNQSTVQATTPAGTLGPANVRLTTAAGTITASQQFTYMPASVSSIAPNQGPAAGGTQITITGSYLALTTGVIIAGVPCTNVTVVNAATVTAVSPAGALGNADVVITGGKGTITVPGGFRYVSIVVPAWATLVEALPNPAVVSDPLLRSAIGSTGLPWRVRDRITQVELMLIPPGTFQMGCVMGSDRVECDPSEQPVHQVTLTNAFYLGRYELTQAQWTATMGWNPSYFGGGSAESANFPVETVSWGDVQGYLSATGMRLPTEAEWEYACRAGTQTPFYNGSTDDITVWNLTWDDHQMHAVGGKAPNGFGLFDMLGNVEEWAADWYGAYSNTPQTNPTGPATGGDRVVRGGSLVSGWNRLRSSTRGALPPGIRNGRWGFRVARTP